MLIFIFIFGFIGFASLKEGLALRTWTYEVISIESSSSNKEILCMELHKQRVSRGVYSISGEVLQNFDICDNDGNTVGVNTYRSALGDGDYKALPLHVPPIDWISFMNTFYKDTVMETFKDCSNLPYTKDKFVAPLVRNNYTLTKCQFSEDGYPNHIEEGMYKMVFYGNGTVDWQVVFIAEVFQTV